MHHDVEPAKASSRNFYEELPSFVRFQDVTNDEHYVEVPDDWVVIVTDVRGSTKAIAENRYKDVNMAGAASITALLNHLRSKNGEAIPFVFGGDGATFLIHESYLEEAKTVLARTSFRTHQAYQLELRVGAVPVRDIHKAHASIEVSKYRMSDNATLAMLRGGGVTLAERLIKEEGSSYLIQPDSTGTSDLSGLSCRWNPIATKRGMMVNLLVSARASERESVDQIYGKVIAHIEQLLDHPESSPVTKSKIRPSFKPDTFKSEILLRGGRRGVRSILYRIRTTMGAALFAFLYKFNLKTAIFDIEKYVHILITNSDFRKFDDMVRMIRDCTQEEYEHLQSYLENERREGRIFYGLHVASEALMTCMVFTSTDHIHFIDGANGGYAMAAKQLKEQLKTAFS